MNNNILAELKRPFHPSVIEFKPQAVTKDGTKAMAIAYADPRAYMNRLDEVCGMDWSVTFTPWGDRIVCHLTISGVTRSSTGEGDSQSERSEIAGTAAEGQAFKRACTMFGLGRYLYDMPSVWVEFDKESKQFTAQGKAKLEGAIVNHYRRWLNEQGTDGGQRSEGQRSEGQKQQAEQKQPARPDEAKMNEFNALGQELYGEQWEPVARHNAERISGGKEVDCGRLAIEDIDKLIVGMRKLQQRRTVPTNGAAVGK